MNNNYLKAECTLKVYNSDLIEITHGKKENSLYYLKLHQQPRGIVPPSDGLTTI